MHHIVQFSIDVDDENVRRIVQEKGAEQVIKNIEKDVRESMFERYGHGRFTSQMEAIIVGVVESWKKEIIEAVVERTVKSLTKTKAVKEAVVAQLAPNPCDCDEGSE